MCGRYVSPDIADIERQWQLVRARVNPFAARFNVSPSTEVPVLVPGEDGGLVLRMGRWGLVPGWWREAKLPRLSHNARAEEAADKPLWRDAMRRGRCLLPMLGWYEWKATTRQPFFFRRADGRLAAVAALYSWWTPPDAQAPLLTCALLTTDAKGLAAQVHDRMPVVLPPKCERAWLAEGAMPVDVDGIARHPVRRLVSDARAEGPQLIEPAPEEAPAPDLFTLHGEKA